MKLIYFFIPFALTTAYAADPRYCEIKKNEPLKTITPKHDPDYFFKTSHQGKYIYYISGGHNYRINTQTKVEELLPGHYDPVPSPDGKILTYLESDYMMGMTGIGSHEQVEKINLFASGDKRTYQSVGQLDNGQYRVFSQAMDPQTQKVVWSYHDFSYQDQGQKFTSIAPPTSLIGTESYRIAMCSKNGGEFAAYNYDTTKTDILKIVDNKIVVADTLPVSGGKADFSSDNSKIIFHMTANHNSNSSYEEVNMGVLEKQNGIYRNIFVYDRESKQLKQITSFDSGSAYFPVFLENNQIMYLYKSDSGKFQFQLVNEPTESVRSITTLSACMPKETANQMIDSLATTWLQLCKNWSGKSNLDMAKISVLNLPKDYCLALAKDANVAPDMSAIFCAPPVVVTPKTNPDVVTPTPNVQTQSTGQILLNNKCAICHSDIPFNDPQKLSAWQDRISERIYTTNKALRMPRMGSLTADEKKTISDYLATLPK